MRLFVYGTLMCPDVMQALLHKRFTGEPATLSNYRRRRVRGQHYPAIVPAPNEEVHGLLYDDISASQWRTLDAFEGDYYRRVAVTVTLSNNGRASAQTYVMRPQYRKRLSANDWQLAVFEKRYKTAVITRYAP